MTYTWICLVLRCRRSGYELHIDIWSSCLVGQLRDVYASCLPNAAILSGLLVKISAISHNYVPLCDSARLLLCDCRLEDSSTIEIYKNFSDCCGNISLMCDVLEFNL